MCPEIDLRWEDFFLWKINSLWQMQNHGWNKVNEIMINVFVEKSPCRLVFNSCVAVTRRCVALTIVDTDATDWRSYLLVQWSYWFSLAVDSKLVYPIRCWTIIVQSSNSKRTSPNYQSSFPFGVTWSNLSHNQSRNSKYDEIFFWQHSFTRRFRFSEE